MVCTQLHTLRSSKQLSCFRAAFGCSALHQKEKEGHKALHYDMIPLPFTRLANWRTGAFEANEFQQHQSGLWLQLDVTALPVV